MSDENSIAAKHREDDGDEAWYRHEAAKHAAAMAKANDCPRCGEPPEWAGDENGHEVACVGCKGVRFGQGPTAARAVEQWNALPADFKCAGYAACENRVDDEDDVCGACEARGENPGGCPGCGGSCRTACR